MHASYMGSGFRDHKRVVEKTVHTIMSAIDEDAPTLVFSGVSGEMIGFPVAYCTGLPFAVVRKSESHSDIMVESVKRHIGKYFIIDDFIQTGETIQRIIGQVEEYHSKSRCVGIVLWGNRAEEGLMAERLRDHTGLHIPIYSVQPYGTEGE